MRTQFSQTWVQTWVTRQPNLRLQIGDEVLTIGGIAALIVDADRYLLATFYQENLKYVRPGQPVEVALDLYDGQIFAGKVEASGASTVPDSICRATSFRNFSRRLPMSPKASMR